jgi:hypothetical protein
MRRERLDPGAVYSKQDTMQVMWPRSIYMGKSQRFVSLTHVERAKGVLGTHGDVPAGLRVVRSMTYLVPEPLNVKFESASEMIKSHPRYQVACFYNESEMLSVTERPSKSSESAISTSNESAIYVYIWKKQLK